MSFIKWWKKKYFTDIFFRYLAGALSWLVSLSGLVWFHNVFGQIWPLWKTHLQVIKLAFLCPKTLKYQLRYLQVFPCHEKCGMVHGSFHSKFDSICPSISLLYEVRNYTIYYIYLYLSLWLQCSGLSNKQACSFIR